jgi:glyoxylase-like metal-dependent hydrolase (beta-lactamase superfamily II)
MMSSFEKKLDEFVELAPGIRRLLAPNPSLMTGPGTNTYLLGKTSIAVVDPGPSLGDHLVRIVECARAPIRWILATHTHPDHSPGVAALAARTGAEVLGMRAASGPHQDSSFAPGRELADGSRLETPEFSLEAIHTPGHASNHLCYLHVDANWILTGDHIIEGSTVVIDPPDGNMRDYLASLKVVRDRSPDALLPGHGERIDEPARIIDGIIEHRLARERRVRDALAAHPGSTAAMLVPQVYADVPERLHGWAERSLLAHLIKLADDGVATERAGQWRLGKPSPLA